MNAVPFDTLKLARGFEAAGMSPAMANGSAEALAGAMKDADCATTADVSLVRTELQGEIAQFRTEVIGEFAKVRLEIGGLRAEVKSDIAALRAEVKGDVAALSAEVKGDIAVSRAEARGDIAELRSESKHSFAGLGASIELLRRDMVITLGGMIFLAAGFVIAAMRYLPSHP